MSRLLGLLCLLVAFSLLGWVAWVAGPIDGRHVLALILFTAGAILVLDEDAP